LNLELKKRSKAEESPLLTSLVTKLNVVDFYVSQLFAYFKRKHENIVEQPGSSVDLES
jgi:hypothetical protein